MYKAAPKPVFDTNAFSGANQRNPQCLCGFQAVCPIITHSSILRTIPVAFIYKSPFISNCDVIICNLRIFILLEFTFKMKYVILD